MQTFVWSSIYFILINFYREWISPAVVIYIAIELINGYNNGDPEIKPLVEKFDFYIVPVANPDGYEYTHTNVDKAFCKVF